MKPGGLLSATCTLFGIGLLVGTTQAMPPFANSTELYVRNGTFANLAARAPGYTLDCAKLPGRPQDHPDWDPRHDKEASCVLESTDIYRHYEVKIPNDRIFDGTRIRERGDNACGSSVFDTLHGIQCMSGFFSCELHEDGVAHLEFSCVIWNNMKYVTEKFHMATCNAFPHVECHRK